MHGSGCSSCRQVYQELARLGGMEQQALLHKQLDELEAPMSLCRSATPPAGASGLRPRTLCRQCSMPPQCCTHTPGLSASCLCRYKLKLVDDRGEGLKVPDSPNAKVIQVMKKGTARTPPARLP